MTFSIFRALGGALMVAVSFVTPVNAIQAAFPALEREALAVRSPERTVLQAAALAGSRVVAVGERGVVALSDDGGQHWRQAAGVPVGVTLTAVRFVDTKRGWAVGHGGVVLQTTDGGEHWSLQVNGRTLARIALDAAQARVSTMPGDVAAKQQLKLANQLIEDGADKPLLDLCFIDALHGFVVGAYGLFFETRDGGLHWVSAMDRLNNPKGLHLYTIRAKGLTIFVAGEQGQLHRSIDGGSSFAPLISPYSGSWFGLAIEPSSAIVVAGLRGNAFRSTDKGATWTRLEGGSLASIVDVTVLDDGTLLLLDQAGQVQTGRSAEKLVTEKLPPLPQPTQLLPLPDGSLLAVGMTGVLHLPGKTVDARGSK